MGVTTAEPSDEALAELDRLHREIAGLGFTLAGTVTQRYIRCTSKGCRCRAKPPQPHGPYFRRSTIACVLSLDAPIRLVEHDPGCTRNTL